MKLFVGDSDKYLGRLDICDGDKLAGERQLRIIFAAYVNRSATVISSRRRRRWAIFENRLLCETAFTSYSGSMLEFQLTFPPAGSPTSRKMEKFSWPEPHTIGIPYRSGQFGFPEMIAKIQKICSNPSFA